MDGFLKQSTASQVRALGPFVDDTDGATAETGLTIANTDIRLKKNGGNFAAKNSGGGTHDELGYYDVTFDATDTNTVGPLKVVCKMAGALVVEKNYWVLEEAIFDALFGASATGLLPANVTQWTGETVPATDVTGVPRVHALYVGGGADTWMMHPTASGVPQVAIAQNIAHGGGTATLDLGQIDTGAINVAGDITLINGISPTNFVAGTINASLTTSERNSIAAAVMASVVEGTTTVLQHLRLAAAALYGKVAGAGTTTVTIRNEADDTDRITATVDADGNRSAVTLDKT